MPALMILPTRRRPGHLSRFVNAYRDTGARVPVMICIDDDEPTIDAYRTIDFPAHWPIRIRPRASYAKWVNLAFDEFPDREQYLFGADDIVPRTVGWDVLLCEAAGLRRISFGQDHHAAPEIATHPCIGGDLVRALGYIAAPGFAHNYIDTIWTEIGRAHGILDYLPHVVMEHMHHTTGKAARDDTYARIADDGTSLRKVDQAAWSAWNRAEIATVGRLLSC